ncbi:hypothetical protein WICPIJ_005907 [Wickerhamomyces pijperi]|uniref:Uncharacterized protein n=1 Tax=Wickerhamomyces pijperi TaxID=599730 RepID=A0A9P8Q5A1_WICPI|nr:hypothetical protein WICPIJ_005907 [Wickerhamomyces pijperi]
MTPRIKIVKPGSNMARAKHYLTPEPIIANSAIKLPIRYIRLKFRAYRSTPSLLKQLRRSSTGFYWRNVKRDGVKSLEKYKEGEDFEIKEKGSVKACPLHPEFFFQILQMPYNYYEGVFAVMGDTVGELLSNRDYLIAAVKSLNVEECDAVMALTRDQSLLNRRACMTTMMVLMDSYTGDDQAHAQMLR